MKGSAKTLHSRSRPRSLTRNGVISAALALLRREGLDSISMRRLAEQLGVTPMALYNHVSDKQDLMAEMTRRLVSGANFESDGGDWQQRINVCFTELRKLLLQHPAVLPLLRVVEPAPFAAFRPLEITVEALAPLISEPAEAMRAFYVLMNFTLGQVMYETRPPLHALDPAHAVRDSDLASARLLEAARAPETKAWNFDAAIRLRDVGDPCRARGERFGQAA